MYCLFSQGSRVKSWVHQFVYWSWNELCILTGAHLRVSSGTLKPSMLTVIKVALDVARHQQTQQTHCWRHPPFIMVHPAAKMLKKRTFFLAAKRSPSSFTLWPCAVGRRPWLVQESPWRRRSTRPRPPRPNKNRTFLDGWLVTEMGTNLNIYQLHQLHLLFMAVKNISQSLRVWHLFVYILHTLNILQ